MRGGNHQVRCGGKRVKGKTLKRPWEKKGEGDYRRGRSVLEWIREKTMTRKRGECEHGTVRRMKLFSGRGKGGRGRTGLGIAVQWGKIGGLTAVITL